MHCTQAAEAVHKTCMKLPAHRVRHGNANMTQTAMQNYLKYTYLFADMLRDQAALVSDEVQVSAGVSCPMSVYMPSDEESVVSLEEQRRFLHPQLRLACFELLDLLCDQLLLRPSRESYLRLSSAEYYFGQKLTQADGDVYWATDSEYNTPSSRRRDILRCRGVETTRSRTNALCCESVAFLVVRNLPAMTLPDHLVDQLRDGCLTFVIGRWFEPHPDAVERDAESRPVCPGPLHINNCLWRYAVNRADRRALISRDGRYTQAVLSQMHVFGQDRESQVSCLENERRAYYCLVLPVNIISTTHMCPLFEPNTSKPDYNTWLESVTLV